MVQNLYLGQKGRISEKFEDTTLNGVLIMVTGKTPATVAMLQNIKLQIIDNSDLSNSVNMLPPNMDLSELRNLVFQNDLKAQDNFSNATAFKWIIPFAFGTHKNLKDGGNLRLDCQVTDDTNFTSVEIAPMYSIGVETSKFLIEKLDLDNTKTEHVLKLGKSVDRVVYLGDTSKIDEIVWKSNIFEFTKKIQELEAYPKDSALTYGTGTPLPLVDRKFSVMVPPMNDCNLTIRQNASASNQSVYVFRQITTPEIARNFSIKTDEHTAENIAIVRGTSVGNSCGCSK
ncbi:MAG: hypothetical protein RBT61_13365 [Candidatus Kapabacteria bacterium]|jgi:hypothetical protein|nr:hypothetical protein [Candidatus Kapabacteria bacterium]